MQTLPAHGWAPRPYQQAAWNYMFGDNKPLKLMVLNWHRRAGKDLFIVNMIMKKTLERKGMYWHGFPELKQGRKAIWEDFTKDGVRKLDYIPEGLRADVNQQELRINLKTGSTYMIVGGDDPDKNLGSGPVGVALSEYSTMNPRMWDLLAPMLGENKGWGAFISTPRGKNHFKLIYDYAASTPGCFAQTLTIEDTSYTDEEGKIVPVITQEFLERERRMGKSDEFLNQEYYCSWTSAMEGAIFGKDIVAMEMEDRVTEVDYDSSLPVYSCWDLGYRDETVCIFYQIDKSKRIRIFDMIHNSNQPISFYCGKVREKPYKGYEIHWVGWDVAIRTIATGNSTFEIARQNGLIFRRCPRHEVNDGLEAIRSALPRIYIDKRRCMRLVDALKEYRYEYDDLRKTFSDKPLHNWSSHFVDALRYGCFSLPRQSEPVDFYKTHRQRLELDQQGPSWDVLNPTETMSY